MPARLRGRSVKLMAWKLIISLISVINVVLNTNSWTRAGTPQPSSAFPFLLQVASLSAIVQSTLHRIFIQKWEQPRNRSILCWKLNCIHVILFLQRGGKATHFWQQNRRFISLYWFSQKKFRLCGENVSLRFTVHKLILSWD